MDWEGGGGFMNDSISEEPQQLTHSVSVGGEDKNKSIAAVSIAQVVKFTKPNDGLSLHGKKIYHANLVAFVLEIVEMNSTKVQVLLDDFTGGGPLEVNHIIGDTGEPDDHSMFNENMQEGQAGDQARTLSSLKLGDYVRCIGVVKYTQEKPNVLAYNMRIIEDPNEVTMHTLEVIRDSMYYERLMKGPGKLSVVKEENIPSNYHQQQLPNASGFGKLSNRDKHILRFIRNIPDPESGMKLDDIVQNFKAFSKAEIQSSLDVLHSEGLSWQGDSEDVWCVTK